MIRVIIVEDDVNIALLHRRFLEKFPNFEVLAIATNVKDAVESIKDLLPDLVLLDIYLKDGSGLDILNIVRDDDLDVDFIVISAAKDIQTIKNAVHKGVFDYLIKPIIFDRLKESLDKYTTYFNNMKQKMVVEQQDIDSFIFGNAAFNTTANSNLPKGIDSITLEKILDILNRFDTPMTAEEIGEKIGASRNTARRYLEYLAEVKVVNVNINYGRIGRPEKEFILVSKMSKNDKM